MNIKQKVRIKIRQMNIDIFSNQILLESIDCQDANAKRFNARKYYLPKGIIKNYNIIVNRKNFYEQTIYSDIK